MRMEIRVWGDRMWSKYVTEIANVDRSKDTIHATAPCEV